MPVDPNILQLIGGHSLVPADIGNRISAGVNAVAQANPPVQIAGRQRRSIVDVLGGIADSIATAGGSTAQYQPNIDARDQRRIAGEDRQREIDLDGLRKHILEAQGRAGDLGNQESEEKLRDAHTEALGQGARGLRAIFGSAGADGVTKAWPFLAHQLGLSDETAQTVGQALAEDPDHTIAALEAATRDPKLDAAGLGLNPFFASDTDGNLQAYQLGKGGQVVPVQLPQGQHPIDPARVVDTGDAQVVIGERSGRPQRILPKAGGPVKGERPVVDRRGRVISYAPVAGSDLQYRRDHPAGSAKTEEADRQRSTMAETALGNLQELRKIYGDLHDMGAMVSPTQGAGQNVAAYGRASRVGQALEGALGTQAQTKRDRVASIRPGLMQSLAKATGMTGRQLDSNADVKLFMQTVTNPQASYEANLAAIAGLERFLHANSQPTAAAAPRQAAPQRRAAPQSRRQAPRVVRPSISNW